MKFFILFVFGSIFLPAYVSAASFFFETKEVPSVGNTIVVSVQATSSALINALDGGIAFNPTYLEVLDVSTGGSIFTMWPRTPVYSNATGRIFFTGGNQKGWKGEGVVFTIVMRTKKVGLSDIFFTDATAAYKADGKGTIEPSIYGSYGVNIVNGTSSIDSWQAVLDDDNQSPTKLVVAGGRSKDIFDNKYFITFSALDAQSGVDHYEIKERTKAPVIAESPYVLAHQSLFEVVRVAAVDKAGNKTTVTYFPLVDSIYAKIVAILSFMILVWFSIKKRHA